MIAVMVRFRSDQLNEAHILQIDRRCSRNFRGMPVYDLRRFPLMQLGAKLSTSTFGSQKTLHGSFTRRK